MKIYTKTGDDGETGLFGGPRVPKDHVRIAAYGDVDELNAVLGWVRTTQPPEGIDRLLGDIQHDLFNVGAELATPDPLQHNTKFAGEHRIAALEASIDQHEASLPPLKQFILPGGSPTAAALHVARAVCRRAERSIVTLDSSDGMTNSSDVPFYMSRLGVLLFVLARSANVQTSTPDVPWNPANQAEEA